VHHHAPKPNAGPNAVYQNSLRLRGISRAQAKKEAKDDFFHKERRVSFIERYLPKIKAITHYNSYLQKL
jgi:hypothetical protein